MYTRAERNRSCAQYFDSDHNGFIDAAELGRVMASLGERLSEHELHDMISAGDRDGDGRVSFKGASVLPGRSFSSHIM